MIMSPLIAFLIVFVLLLIALIKLKVTPSVGLFAAAIIFGLMVGMPAADILSKLPAGFGNMMTSIGLLIVFGSIFGDFLGNSGATEELAKGMVRLFGKKNDYLALNLVGFILSIPIYFGCAYIMTAPLVTALQKISKKSMKGYVIAIFTGLMLTHSCVAPTPGPLAVAGQIGANVGWFIIWGIIVCLPASLLVGWVYANLVNSKEEKQRARDAMKEIVEDEDLLAPDPTKPSALKAFLLVMFPIVLIVFAAIFSLFVTEGPVYTVINFVGNSNIALFIAMLVTGYVLHPYMPEKDRHAVHRRLCRPHWQCPAHCGCRWMLRLHAGGNDHEHRPRRHHVRDQDARHPAWLPAGVLHPRRCRLCHRCHAHLHRHRRPGVPCLWHVAHHRRPLCLSRRQRRHLPDGRYLLVSVHLQRSRYQRLPRHYDDPLHSVRCHRHGHSGRAQRLLRRPPRNVLNFALGIGKGEYYALTQ